MVKDNIGEIKWYIMIKNFTNWSFYNLFWGCIFGELPKIGGGQLAIFVNNCFENCPQQTIRDF